MSLEEISTATKISVRFFEAIEAGQVGRLPGGIFNRSFVRAYARYLGLNEEEIVGQYMAASGEAAAATSEPEAPAQAAAGMSAQTLLAFVVVVVVALAAYSGYRLLRQHQPAAADHAGSAASSRSKPADVAPHPAVAPPSLPARSDARGPVAGTLPRAGFVPQPLAAKPAATGSTAGTFRPPSGGAGASAVSSAAVHRAAAAPALGAVTLRISVSAPAWVKLEADHKLVFEDTLTPGTERTFALNPPLRLVTGNANATHVTLNGQPQPSLGGIGAIAFWRYPPGATEKPAAKPSGAGGPSAVIPPTSSQRATVPTAEPRRF